MKQMMEQNTKLEDQTPDPCINTGDSNGIVRRNNKGCKSQDFYNWPEQPFEDMDSPFYYQQYIQQLIHRNPADIDEILRLPEGQDLGVWKVEHLRLFCMQLNQLAARLQDCCHPETCNQMTATEQWIFLCAAHKQPNECPAIDYTRHTLDGAASLLNSNKYFPSRVTVKENSVAKLGSVCRRIYRIFSHAYYHHFQVFEEFERDTHLCERFSKFVTMYDLMPKESLIVPADGPKSIEQQQQASSNITNSGEQQACKSETETEQHLQQADTTIIQESASLQQTNPSAPGKTPSTSETTTSPSEDVSKSTKEPNNNDSNNSGDNSSTVIADVESKQTSTPSPDAASRLGKRTQTSNLVEDQNAKSTPGWTAGQAHSTNTMVKGSSKIPTTSGGGAEASPSTKKQPVLISSESNSKSGGAV